MTVPSPIRRPAAQDDVRLEDHVGGQLDRRLDVGGGRVVHRDAGQEVALVDPRLEAVGRLGQLRPGR